MENVIIHDDCISGLKRIPASTVDLILTSPPYAEQRKHQYGGIAEADYPAWTVAWMEAGRKCLTPSGSVAVVIRPHLKDGQISDYVLRTRLAIRQAGWIECEELIWVKPDSGPLGSNYRPRRAWESILWFSRSRRPYCDSKANGNVSQRIGMECNKGQGTLIKGFNNYVSGVARCRDYVEVGISSCDRENSHPAQYPEALSTWLVKLLCPPGGMVVDPFIGSGTTAISCIRTGRHYIGIDQSAEYVEMVNKRIKKVVSKLVNMRPDGIRIERAHTIAWMPQLTTG